VIEMIDVKKLFLRYNKRNDGNGINQGPLGV
jgi:hypothetical protein